MRIPAMIHTWAVIAGFFFLPRLSIAGVLPFERSVPIALAAILCDRSADVADFIRNGVFDAQVEALQVKPRDPKRPVDRKYMRERARDLAVSSGNPGYAFGACENGSGWALAMPANAAVSLSESVMTVPHAIVRQCVPTSLKILFAPEKGGRSLLLPVDKEPSGALTVTLPSQKGFSAVTCVHRGAVTFGPRELALVPSGGVSLSPTVSAGVKENLNTEELLAWLNDKRKAAALPPLAVHPDLALAAKSLVGNRLVHHDIQALARIGQVTRLKGVEAIGENRASGRSLSEVAGLFWISPSHRDLLLNPAADVAGFATANDERGEFVVLVVGKKSSGAVSRLLKN